MTSIRRIVITVLQCVLFLMGWTFLATAQSSYTGQLSGVVTDSSGGVIPSAKVTLTDEATGIPLNTQTDARGIYVFTGIRPAIYRIRVEAPNLTVQERRELTIAVSQQATLDFILTPRSVSESVS